MKFYPRLHQTQLLAGQFTCKNFTVAKANLRLEFSVSGMNVRQVVVLVVEQVQADDDAVEHRNDWHVVFLVIWLMLSVYLLKMRGERLHLQGADYPDGCAKHDADCFWVHKNQFQ
ncbi:hypothetical protein Cenrod_2421 [Candidatus Symbiobacter mobilis CR]|uniref:Uncharacterized protein n=1 Tax=Candidatus Symbiobacter mobilis CR TaxID=946483 RepID=U5NEB1_9BURK|nr:hypothetical protein Cenrod_2421 [Candidatus Symbiobacter mobilis CR]